MDIEGQNQKLALLHNDFSSNLPGYLALCEAGSVTAGDPLVPGLSDRDITIVVENLTSKVEQTAQELLSNHDFDDQFLFIIFDKDRFLTTRNDQDISMKFRGKTQFGTDLVSQKETPSREFALEVGTAGLKSMSKKFRTRLLNSAFWSDKKIKAMLYSELKHLIMYVADIQYAKTGHYPKLRKDVAETLDSNDLRKIADVLSNYDSASKADVTAATRAAIKFQDSYEL